MLKIGLDLGVNCSGLIQESSKNRNGVKFAIQKMKQRDVKSQSAFYIIIRESNVARDSYQTKVHRELSL